MKCLTAHLLLCSIFILGGFKSPPAATADPKWGSLKLTYGPIGPIPVPFFVPFMAVPHPFSKMPLNIKAAEKEGFKKLNAQCAGENYQGFRYSDKKDQAVTLIYDVNGNLAGIQTTYGEREMKNKKDNKVKKWFQQHPMLIKTETDDDTFYTATAYFMDPDFICNKERALERFLSFGHKTTGIHLYLKNGTTNVRVPSEQSDLAETHWTKGRKFPKMGMHYWYDTSLDMDCDYFQPFFLLYNKGKLNGFGFAVYGHFKSSRFEYPPQFVIPLFMKDVPKCMFHVHESIQPVSTMHVYFDVPKYIDFIF